MAHCQRVLQEFARTGVGPEMYLYYQGVRFGLRPKRLFQPYYKTYQDKEILQQQIVFAQGKRWRQTV